MEKSWNQKYKESGSTLSYKDWRKREDEKMSSFDGTIAPNFGLESDSLKRAREEMARKGGLQSDVSGKTTLGISHWIWISAGVIVLAAIGYKIYKNSRK